jgi:hypothetical protein
VVALAVVIGWAVREGPAVVAASASPSTKGSVLRVCWTEKPDNLNPFIGTQTTV